MGYTENISSILKWGNSFQRQFDFPLDRTSIHSSYEDAVRYARGEKGFDSGNYFNYTDENGKPLVDERGLCKLAYIGQTITVWGLNEKGKEGVWVYSLVPAPEGSDYLADLKPVGSATTETAKNYIAAKALSEGLAVGQLIQVEEAVEVEETVEGVTVKNTYQAGFYIVNAPGSISALGTTSGADDEIGALESRVSALESNKVAKTEFETYQGQVTDALAGKVSNDALDTYKQEVTADLDAKVDDEEFATYQGQVTDLLAGKVDNSYKEEVTNALAGKVDNSYKQEVTDALAGKVDNDALNTYKQEVADDLDAKVDDTVLEAYQEEVTAALAEKATVEALNTLEGKVDTDIQNLTTLTGKVDKDIQDLADHMGEYDTHLENYAGKVNEIDGRLADLEAFEDNHIAHEGITISEIESLFAPKSEA